MSKITLEQFCEQWVSGNYTTKMANKLYYNVQDFVTVAGDYARQQFAASFERGGFCGGSKWAPRTSKWGKKFTHPTLNDTGALAKGIKSEDVKTSNIGRLHSRGGFRRDAWYHIYTSEESSSIKGKRGRKKGKYKNYAAIHNTDPKFGLYTVNQYSTRRPVHRQFIGFSPKIADYIMARTEMIFEGFPK